MTGAPGRATRITRDSLGRPTFIERTQTGQPTLRTQLRYDTGAACIATGHTNASLGQLCELIGRP